MRHHIERFSVAALTLAAALVLGTSLLAATASSPALDVARQLNQAFIEVADQVSPSVVVIRIAHKAGFADVRDHPLYDMLPPEAQRQLEERFREEQDRQRRRPQREPVFDEQGSGVVIREDGYILTNRHVVEGADRIRVRLKDGREYDAEVRGVDAQSDIAVVRIKDKSVKGLPVARMADSSKVRVGEFAIAIGAPFELDYSVTFGHVSAKGRSRIVPDPSMDQDFIQTDANINPGNSGGPLVNINGEVIGINTLIRGLSTGIGFAIPSSLAREVAQQLMDEGKFTRAWLGVGIRALSEDPDFRATVKGVKEGVVVNEIRKDGPAAKSDLKASDIITAVDGKPVATAQDLRNEIRSKKIGSSITLDIVRNGRNAKVKVQAEEWPEEQTQVASRRPAPARQEPAALGMTVKALTPELAKEYGLEKVEGVIVASVTRGGPAEEKGIRPGDVITDVNHQTVRTPSQFREALKEVDTKKGVVVNLVTKNGSRFEILKDSGE